MSISDKKKIKEIVSKEMLSFLCSLLILHLLSILLVRNAEEGINKKIIEAIDSLNYMPLVVAISVSFPVLIIIVYTIHTYSRNKQKCQHKVILDEISFDFHESVGIFSSTVFERIGAALFSICVLLINLYLLKKYYNIGILTLGILVILMLCVSILISIEKHMNNNLFLFVLLCFYFLLLIFFIVGIKLLYVISLLTADVLMKYVSYKFSAEVSK